MVRQAGNFTYSLAAPGPPAIRGCSDFLFTSRTGYCDSSRPPMAVLARMLDIPSRVAMG